MRLPDTARPARRRARLATAACAIALACAGCASTKRPPRPVSQAYVVAGPRVPLPALATTGGSASAVELFAHAGNIRVRSAAEAWLEPTYSVCADSAAEAASILDMATIGTSERSGGVTHVELITPRDCPLEKLAADTLLALPGGVDLDLRTVNGVIDTSNHSAKNAKFRTTDGNLILGRVEKELRFETQSGRVELLGEAQSVKGSTRDGDILVNTVQSGAQIELRTESGTCRIHLDPVLSAQVIYRTKRGSLHVEIRDSQLDRRAVPRFDDWVERRILFHGAAPVAKACLIVVESARGDLVLARPPAASPAFGGSKP